MKLGLREALTPPVRPSLRSFDPDCWLAAHGRYEGPSMPPCEGRLVRVHLIPKQLISRECGCDKNDPLVWDDAVWVWGCGGITGCSGHHGALDVSRRLRIARDEIPARTEAFAAAHHLAWFLERTYGGPDGNPGRGGGGYGEQ